MHRGLLRALLFVGLCAPVALAAQGRSGQQQQPARDTSAQKNAPAPTGSIAGRILDEDGEPMPGATVRVMRYQYLQGDRRLVPVGTSQTDDKGNYRVWGLMPGDYYVTATGRGFGGIVEALGGLLGATDTGGRAGRGGGGGPGGDGGG